MSEVMIVVEGGACKWTREVKLVAVVEATVMVKGGGDFTCY